MTFRIALQVKGTRYHVVVCVIAHVPDGYAIAGRVAEELEHVVLGLVGRLRPPVDTVRFLLLLSARVDFLRYVLVTHRLSKTTDSIGNPER